MKTGKSATDVCIRNRKKRSFMEIAAEWDEEETEDEAVVRRCQAPKRNAWPKTSYKEQTTI